MRGVDREAGALWSPFDDRHDEARPRLWHPVDTIGEGIHELRPVSYTHLDVYKRQSRAYLAVALHRLGRTADAFDEILAAVVLARKAPQILPAILAMLANMELDAGRARGALEHAEEAVDALTKTRSDGGHEIYVRVTYARALSAGGRTDDAQAALREAHTRLRARLQLIQTPHLRACFERVEENATVLGWAR